MRILLLFYVVIFLSSWAVRPAELPERNYQQTNNPSVFYIWSYNGRCTAFAVEKNTLATAAHCTGGLKQVAVEMGDTTVIADVVYEGQPMSDNDLALLSISVDVKPFEIGEAQDGDGCFTVGYAGTSIQQTMPCFVEDAEGLWGMELLGQVRRGDSGGPVLGPDNTVIGVVYALSAERTGWAVPSYRILEALQLLPQSRH